MAKNRIHPCPQCGSPIGVRIYPDGYIEYTDRVSVCDCILTDAAYEAEQMWAEEILTNA